jgi:peptidyl-prolyl cis-trans isomerase C
MVTQVRASHILVKNEDDANRILKRINDGEDFAAVARRFSSCPSGKNGGDLGWFGKGKMVPEFERAAFALNPGQMTNEPVKTQFGYHIIKRTG